MSKIIFVTTGDISKIATSKRAFGMAKPLSNLGWEVSIILYDCSENRYRVALECDESVKVYYYKSLRFIDEIFEKNHIVAKGKYDYIYISSFTLRNFQVFRRSTKIIVEHSELLSSISNYSFLKRSFYKFLEITSSIYADKLVCASKYLYDYFNKISYRKSLNIHYSPYAYNDEIIYINKENDKIIKTKYAQKKVIIYMGTIAINYGIMTILEAVNEILSNHKDNFIVLFLGRGRHLDDALSYVNKNNLNNNIDFLGYVPEDELSMYLSIADAFLSPVNNTIQDIARCPSKIYMYLPYNKPILTCKHGEPKEIFGTNGFYFDFTSHTSLAELILGILDKDEVSTPEISSNHTWNVRAKHFDEWLKLDL